MITEYPTGAAFWEDNCGFLNTNPYLSVFFKLDCPYLTRIDEENYALKCESGDHKLLAMKVVPFHLLLFGDAQCVPELLDYLMHSQYNVQNYLCASELGDAVREEFRTHHGISYKEALPMDFMEATEETEPSSAEVTAAEESDLEEVWECLKHFIVDCGLMDQPNRENTEKTLGAFRVIREDGHVVSMAKMVPATQTDIRITNVYTRDAYRGKGYARKVVNTLKNEILAAGKAATLNVDRNNPITCHLYTSLGFKRIFSQGEFRRIN